MLIVAATGPYVVKVDLLLDLAERRPSADSPAVTAATLPGIDAHFWDWNLWLGSKRLRATETLVRAELAKMWGYLLKPLGGIAAPTTQREAIAEYLRQLQRLERRLDIHIPPDLGRAVQATLAASGVLCGRWHRRGCPQAAAGCGVSRSARSRPFADARARNGGDNPP